ARGIILIRYAMLGFKVGEKFSNWPTPAPSSIFQALPDAFTGVGAGRDIQQTLISLRVLDDRGGSALHRENHRALVLFELFHKVARSSAKGRQRLDVFGYIKHAYSYCRTFLGALWPVSCALSSRYRIEMRSACR